MTASYVLPLRRAGGPPPPDLTAYLAWLAPRVDVLVVDGSPPEVRDGHAAAWKGLPLRHVAPDPSVGGLNGKVRGVLTGLHLAAFERVVIADDDVRYDDWWPSPAVLSWLRRRVGGGRADGRCSRRPPACSLRYGCSSAACAHGWRWPTGGTGRLPVPRDDHPPCLAHCFGTA